MQPTCFLHLTLIRHIWDRVWQRTRWSSWKSGHLFWYPSGIWTLWKIWPLMFNVLCFCFCVVNNPNQWHILTKYYNLKGEHLFNLIEVNAVAQAKLRNDILSSLEDITVEILRNDPCFLKTEAWLGFFLSRKWGEEHAAINWKLFPSSIFQVNNK